MCPCHLTVLFFNIFYTLFIVANNSVHKLRMDLIEIESVRKHIKTSIPLVPELFTFNFSTYVLFEFMLSYFSLAAHVIAFYPILNQNLPDLLIPTLICQCLQNVLLESMEFSFGCFICRYYLPHAKAPCQFFYTKMLSKVLMGILVLHLFGNYYMHLKYPPVKVVPTREFLNGLSKVELRYVKSGRRESKLLLINRPGKEGRA